MENKTSEIALDKNLILEQYKLYLELTDRISSRRDHANTFFLTLNTAIIAVASYLNSVDKNLLISLSGIVLCILWYCLIKSYRGLNSAKFEVVHKMEQRLPLQPYHDEWELLGRGKNSKKYRPFTHIEMKVPLVFGGIHFLEFLFNIPWRYMLDSIPA